ncbi:MAG: dehydrogenase, partial [Candidatus Syntrophosphaera sp.]
MKKTAFRNDGVAKVTGRALYTDDLKMPGMLHAVPVYSELPRAKLLSIDPAKTLEQPGVVAVFTAKDIPGNVRFGQIIKDYPTLADEDINSTGDV